MQFRRSNERTILRTISNRLWILKLNDLQIDIYCAWRDRKILNIWLNHTETKNNNSIAYSSAEWLSKLMKWSMFMDQQQREFGTIR